MKKYLLTIFSAVLIGSFATSASAQMMGNVSKTNVDWNEVIEHTAREEREGKEFWDKLLTKEIVCPDLSEEQFGALGEYFMGQMTGNSHAAMNAMMIQAHGEEGEEQIHIVMGKRLSGCDTTAAFPAISGGWIPMMNMMWGGTNIDFDSLGSFGWMFMVLWWVLIITGIIAIIKWLSSQSRRK